jgi:protein gp37
MASWNGMKSDGATDEKLIADGFIKSVRPRVFCSSLSDWLDDEVPVEWLADLLDLIRKTPNLDWLLLTKRPENWRGRLKAVRDHVVGNVDQSLHSFVHSWLDRLDIPPPANIWIGATVENQEMAEKRIPQLLSIPANIRFLSCEPLLEAIDISKWLWTKDRRQYCDFCKDPAETSCDEGPCPWKPIHWVIAGGESGGNARPMHPDWVRSLHYPCAVFKIPFLFKQWGEWLPVDQCKHLEDALPLTKEYRGHKFSDGCLMLRVGKKSSGRLLDGVRHHEFPSAK